MGIKSAHEHGFWTSEICARKAKSLSLFLFSKQATFGDFAPYMILAEDALAMLNKELPLPMEMERFRPNIVVADLSAFEEVSLSTNDFRGCF